MKIKEYKGTFQIDETNDKRLTRLCLSGVVEYRMPIYYAIHSAAKVVNAPVGFTFNRLLSRFLDEIEQPQTLMAAE